MIGGWYGSTEMSNNLDFVKKFTDKIKINPGKLEDRMNNAASKKIFTELQVSKEGFNE